ncbi:Hypothetical protein PENO1_063700 [Penicillium occitanis (nom. inval.)]|nr:Hypothetical protein PENO1_063700 [Penicillium occitanis (nom. inval.)]PCG97747.1 hypothetical protein PENOC_066440 [Penicillium occitanis (nom. inval.)]
MAPSLQDLTVSDVSGMIAAAIAAALTLSAVTWSVLARELQSSYWPSILRTDSSTTSGVLKSVSIVSWSKTIAKLLTAIAAVVTPLGLYEDISPQTTPKLVPFHYIDDKSPFGIGTPPREIDMRFSRICGGFYPVGCPNSHTNVTSFSNATGIYVSGDWYDSHIPQYVINSFESGISSMAPSVSSVFDIQSRYQTWAQAVESNDTIPIDNNTAYPVSVFRQIGSLIVNGGIQLLEGLVVDLQSGGVGFRNHTAPPWQPFGSTWSEDLLFIQPDTECVNLNLTLDFNVPRSFSLGGSGFSDLVLTDRGGFSRIQQNSPLYSTNVGSQKDPDMFNRAYAAAWVNNFLSMLFLNITNPAEYNNSDSGAFQYLESSVGKQFPLMRNGTSESSFSFLQHAPMSVNIDSLFGYYLSGADYAYPGINTTGFNVTGLGDNFTDPQPALYPNPFQITEENFTAAGAICKRTTQYDYANISNIATACGMIYGVPQRQSLGNPLIFDPGSNWSIPMYTCATATKALIKTVTFQFNGSDDLSGLKVTQISEKVYPDGTSMPLWAVENTNLSMSDVAPLWGLVTPDTARQINISSWGIQLCAPSSMATINADLTRVSPHDESHLDGPCGQLRFRNEKLAVFS